MNAYESMELIKKYGSCDECGSESLGNGSGTLNIDNDVFTRTCRCGWSVTVDKRIKVIDSTTRKLNGKTVGIYEVRIYGEKEIKLLPADELKQMSGVKRINQHAKVEEWLNTAEGRKWVLATPATKIQ